MGKTKFFETNYRGIKPLCQMEIDKDSGVQGFIGSGPGERSLPEDNGCMILRAIDLYAFPNGSVIEPTAGLRR